MDVREKQVSERVADTLSLGQVDNEISEISLDLGKKGEREYVSKVVAKELIAYMNKTKWLRISYHNHRMKKASGPMDYYIFSSCKITSREGISWASPCSTSYCGERSVA